MNICGECICFVGHVRKGRQGANNLRSPKAVPSTARGQLDERSGPPVNSFGSDISERTRIAIAEAEGAPPADSLGSNISERTRIAIRAAQNEDPIPLSPRTSLAVIAAQNEDHVHLSPRTRLAVIAAQSEDIAPQSPGSGLTAPPSTQRSSARADEENWNTRAKELEHLRDQQETDEWLERECRLCPECGRKINRVAGCSEMVCGRDTHGKTQGPGCGHNFDWRDAKPYKAEPRSCGNFGPAERLQLDQLKQLDEHAAKSAIAFALRQGDIDEGERKSILNNDQAALNFRSSCGCSVLDLVCMYPTPDNGSHHACLYLIQQRADVGASVPPRKTSALCIASRNGNIGAVQVLLAHNANVNAADVMGETPLSHAVKNKELSDDVTLNICKVLLGGAGTPTAKEQATKLLTPQYDPHLGESGSPASALESKGKTREYLLHEATKKDRKHVA